MAKSIENTLFILIFSVTLIFVNCVRYGFQPDVLHVQHQNDDLPNQPQIINSLKNNLRRSKRETKENKAPETIGNIVLPATNSNISPKINYLNDSHAQLMVHWLGDNSNIMICLARDLPASLDDPIKRQPNPSAVYLSYNYGDTFVNKTDLFKVLIDGVERPSTLDQFSTHPKFNTIIFTDSRNKAIFNVPQKITENGTNNIKRYMLNFTPSDISFYEQDSQTFLVLDKEDEERKLYLTTDGGMTFSVLQMYVKSFQWSSGDDMPTHLYVERKEPTGTSSVIFYNASDLFKTGKLNSYNKLIDNVQDFHIKKDFMFGVRKVLNTTQVFVSYRRKPFVKALFQTELDIKGIHICDVEGRRIILSAAHSDIQSHLYVSENNLNMTSIKFVPSLENVFTYIPNVMWKAGWLTSNSNEAFTDLYKVEGITGIYIASKVNRNIMDTVGPEHLFSVITFDHGGNWQSIKAPLVDDENQPLNCTNCSLHLSQKFSNLYPVTRSVQMMSSKLAPGIIMASGVVGSSLKGYPGVYLSRDAGMTWKQILKTYHFFNFGDHGGVLVAVKYFKLKGETREIIYSTDEGETWKNQSFHSDDLKIYGLMTEPNSNRTIFTLFGSEKKEHRWLIIKVDLINAFSRNCTKDDYKFWAPSSKSGESLMPCILGTQRAFQRRVHNTNCYNGIQFERQLRTETCVCTKWDFECDFGFSRISSNSHCTFNKSMSPLVNPYEIPSDCKPGNYYNRTRGYRKIEGDVCVSGFENRYLPQTIACPLEEESNFLLVAQRNKISRIDLTTYVRDELPVRDLKNVIAIDFDMKNNCVFFADIMSDVIGRQCLNGNTTPEILVDRDLASVEGMSYDWVSEMIFFVDGTRSVIEGVVTKPGNLYRSRVTIIDKKHLIKPRGIVVHPTEGYIFWTEWSSPRPSLSRANLDGSEVKVLFTKPTVVWPNGVTIDHFAQRVYWVDANKDYIGSCDLNGDSFHKIIDQDTRVEHPFAVGVFKDQIYWDDWKMNSIFSANKDHGIMVLAIAQQMENLMDLKIYAHSLQEGKNACSNNNCSHICVGAPRGEFSCLCPNGMVKSNKTNECVCPGGQKAFANLTCLAEHNTCAPGYFNCKKSRLCIPKSFRCDEEYDCDDKSDEEDCPTANDSSCGANQFQCQSNKKCIPQTFVCDMEHDCPDGSDEKGCTPGKCKNDEFTCANGNCISLRWKCDRENDCQDNSDEKDCPTNKPITNGTLPTITCKPNEFRCTNNNMCIPNEWMCDRDHDCSDGSDEVDCKNRECESWENPCGNGKCIYKTWWCDGDIDCENGADEKNCTNTKNNTSSTTETTFFPNVVCHEWMFKCANNKCIPTWWKCDKVNDCGDNSDEMGCSNSQDGNTNTIGKTTAKPQNNKSKCPINQFECNSGICISKAYVCDGQSDCSDGEDEKNCPPVDNKCDTVINFRCKSDGMCLPLAKICDKIKNCADGSDEEYCESHQHSVKPISEVKIQCENGFFNCDNMCHPIYELCDLKTNCHDGTDEENCANAKRVYQVNDFTIVHPITYKSFLLLWEIKNLPSSVHMEYLPSISTDDKWRNNSVWISDTKFHFNDLQQMTTYNVTVYTRFKGESDIIPPYLYKTAKTLAGMPNKPLNPHVVQLNGTRVQVSWEPPKETLGKVLTYTVYYRPESFALGSVRNYKVTADVTNAIIDSDFKGNVTYEFWVRARNTEHESPVSKMIKLTFNNSINIDIIEGLKIQVQTDNRSVILSWNKVATAEGYSVEISFPEPYPKMEVMKTNSTEMVFTSLPSSVQVLFKVSAYVRNYSGRQHSIKQSLVGEPLPEIKNIRIQQNPDFVKIQWDAPKIKLNEKNITFAVYYGTSTSELFEKARLTTQHLEAEIKDMMPCQSYLISVGILGPIGPGPLSYNHINIETMANDKKPPRNLTAFVNPKTHYMIINWEHNCPISNRYPSYILTVNETVKNYSSIYQLKRSSNKTLSHYLQDIPHGAVYNVSVRSDIQGSEPTILQVAAPKLEGPRQLTIWMEKNRTIAVYWRVMENYYHFNFTYEILIYKGLISGNIPMDAEVIKTISAKSAPISVNINDLVQNDDTFTFGIRITSEDGYSSEISETEHIQIESSSAGINQANKSKSIIWLILIPLLVISALGGVTFFLIQRHRRLQNSFSRFANSHYDTKTGATRIGDTLEDEETMHQIHERNQHRFAVDEPLVT